MINYIGYHGTDAEHFKTIKKQGFKLRRPNDELPCDLGHGVYMYIDRKEIPHESAHDNATKYLGRYKPDYKEPIILKLSSKIEDSKVLNLNDLSNQSVFLHFKKVNLKKIESKVSTLKENKTLRRGKIDGLVLNLMIDNMKIEVDAIIKDTYTPFDFEKYRQSNIPNGREMCLRNSDRIESCEISENVW